jgi:hypothetical protein
MGNMYESNNRHYMLIIVDFHFTVRCYNLEYFYVRMIYLLVDSNKHEILVCIF